MFISSSKKCPSLPLRQASTTFSVLFWAMAQTVLCRGQKLSCSLVSEELCLFACVYVCLFPNHHRYSVSSSRYCHTFQFPFVPSTWSIFFLYSKIGYYFWCFVIFYSTFSVCLKWWYVRIYLYISSVQHSRTSGLVTFTMFLVTTVKSIVFTWVNHILQK